MEDVTLMIWVFVQQKKSCQNLYIISFVAKHSLALNQKLKNLCPDKANCMAFKSGDANEKILELVNYAKMKPFCRLKVRNECYVFCFSRGLALFLHYTILCVFKRKENGL